MGKVRAETSPAWVTSMAISPSRTSPRAESRTSPEAMKKSNRLRFAASSVSAAPAVMTSCSFPKVATRKLERVS